jgi:hypothetical protein
MKSNVNNQFGTAPDHGLFTGPILGPISPEDRAKIHPGLANETVTQQLPQSTGGVGKRDGNAPYAANNDDDDYDHHHGYIDDIVTRHKSLPRQSDSYWLDNVAHGVMPLAPSNYTFFRNVQDYGAKGDGSQDDTAFINAAVTDGNRCGPNCGSSTVLGALVYFPPGMGFLRKLSAVSVADFDRHQVTTLFLRRSFSTITRNLLATQSVYQR